MYAENIYPNVQLMRSEAANEAYICRTTTYGYHILKWHFAYMFYVICSSSVYN